MACPHLNAPGAITKSIAGIKLHKDECTRCFYNVKNELGIDLCLSCFNGSCPINHTFEHFQKFQHPLVMNLKVIKQEVQQNNQQQQITKLAIGVPGGLDGQQDQWETHFQLKCLACSQDLNFPENLSQLRQSILTANSALFAANVQAWEQEFFPCEHTLTLQQNPPFKIAGKQLAHCNNCELSSNLWLCLTCGNLGCGRKMYDGTGGNNHGIEHFQSAQHPLVVKMGTITPEGEASVHCYGCENEVIDESLKQHLENFGIQVENQVKTESTIAELSLQANLNFTLSKAVEDGRTLISKYGPGFTGLENLGNSCYMNSILQVLFNLPEFQERYYNQGLQHSVQCMSQPAECFRCQIFKVFQGLMSGDYSQQKQKILLNGEEEFYQDGIKPAMFKNIVARGNEEFSSNRQQDALEYLTYLLTVLERNDRASGLPVNEFPGLKFEFKQHFRYQCLTCKGVKYKEENSRFLSLTIPIPVESDSEELVVDFEQIINGFLSGEVVDLNCSRCNKLNQFSKQVRIKNFPPYLIFVTQRFVYSEWVPKKLLCNFKVPLTDFNLVQLQSHWSEGNEDILQEVQKNNLPQFNQEDLAQLSEFGFTLNQIKHALYNSQFDRQQAAEWLFENGQNPCLDVVFEQWYSQNVQGEKKEISAPPQVVAQVMEMGFNEGQVKYALSQTVSLFNLQDNDPERAVEWLFSHPEVTGAEFEQLSKKTELQLDYRPPNYKLSAFITHLGKSVHAGHYVSHILKNNEWILFNDSKVAASSDPPFGKAYVFLFTKQ